MNEILKMKLMYMHFDYSDSGDWTLFGIWPACRRQGFGYWNLIYYGMISNNRDWDQCSQRS